MGVREDYELPDGASPSALDRCAIAVRRGCGIEFLWTSDRPYRVDLAATEVDQAAGRMHQLRLPAPNDHARLCIKMCRHNALNSA